MRSTRSTLLAFAAMAAAALGSGVTVATQEGTTARAEAVQAAAPKHANKAPTSPEQRAAWLRVRGHAAASRRFPGRGWTVAHDRRMARKRRNVIKARRANRG
ncbi:hypothetical protein ACG04Q_12000 [Roseateles sp. DXS20W]|uniref:DUF4148 domain-containing protein n=1 Tax=Pelomonas lactea TaxID=3299030 RepID=A0ABW7GKC1_9BURK